MDNFKKEERGGYTSAGRRLRPSKRSMAASSRNAEPVYSSKSGRTSYGESRPERSQYSEKRNFGASRSSRPSGEGRPSTYGEHRPYGQSHPSANREHRPYGQSRPSANGEHRSFGQGHPSANGERRSFGKGHPSANGERRSFGQGRPSANGERRSFDQGRPSGNGGMRKPKRNNALFNKSSEDGINRMISRRPQLNGEVPAGQVPEMIQEEVRLNKFIANSGICSRREADTMIQAGVVTVNGEVVTELGTKINVFNDEVRFNGERLKGEQKVYLVMNKPKGYVTSVSDPHAEKTVMDLLKGCSARVYPVGRLDKGTTGVLMFTNDGELAERLTHPAYDKKKIYQVILDKPLSEEDHTRILEGIELSDGLVSADSLEFIDEDDHRKLGIEIHSGKNRIVRRIFESCGYEVRALDRVYFAGLTKKGLKKGEWRFLTEAETNILKMGAYL